MNNEQNTQQQTTQAEVQKNISKGSTKAWLWGLVVLLISIGLVGAFLERLWRIPFGGGIMIVFVIFLVAYGFPSWFKIIKRNRQLEKENKDLLAKQGSS